MVLLAILSLAPVTAMGIADMMTDYPEVDMGVGVGFTLWQIPNYESQARIGLYAAADINRDLALKPNWLAVGGFIGRAIQQNVTIGAFIGYRGHLHAGMYLGIDVVPWLGRKP